jgi:hypothetical protein
MGLFTCDHLAKKTDSVDGAPVDAIRRLLLRVDLVVSATAL